MADLQHITHPTIGKFFGIYDQFILTKGMLMNPKLE
jgi:hypothetical protein